MSYNRTVWVNDSLPAINAENLNKIENQLEQNTNDIANIIESGSNDNGSWVKYSDGTMVCRRTFSITLDCRQQWGNLYVAIDENIINFPQEFIETPFVIRDLLTSSSASCWLINYSIPNITTKTYRNFAIARATPSDSVPIQLNLLAIGKWK